MDNVDLKDHNINLKCVLLGNSGVGKSSILNNYLHGSIDEVGQTTLGAVFWKIKHNFNFRNWNQATQSLDLVNIKLSIDVWDTAGQERFSGLIPMYTRGVDIAILVFDLNDKFSFEQIKYWKNLVLKTSDDALLILVGNKEDMSKAQGPSRGEINTLVMKEFEEANFFRTSAKMGSNIVDLFIRVFKILEPKAIDRFRNKNKINNNLLNNVDIKIEEGRKCCY